MKTRFAVLLMPVLTTALLMNVATPTLRADASLSIGMSLNFDSCYNELSPYGTWYESPEFGWVWTPGGIGPGWGPYVNGNWACTSSGWMWQSSYPWGWMTYHYGRWARHPSLGWCWVPGYEWAPSWVTWYTYGNYVGWAPIAPCGFGVSYTVYPSDWCFVSFNYFLSPMVWSYYVASAFICPAVCAPYVVMNNYYFFGNQYYFAGGRRCDWYGPGVPMVERHINRRITPYVLATTTDRSRNGAIARNQLEVYRPGMRDGGALARSDRPLPAERVEQQRPPGAAERVERAGNSAGKPGAAERVERAGNSAGKPGAAGRIERAGNSIGKPGSAGRIERAGNSIGTPGSAERVARAGNSIGKPGAAGRVEQPKSGLAPRPMQVPRAEQLRNGFGAPVRVPNVNARPSFAPARGGMTRPANPAIPSAAQRAEMPRGSQPGTPNMPAAPRVSHPSMPAATPRVSQPSMPSMPAAAHISQPSAPRMPSAPSTPAAPRMSAPSMPSMPSMAAPRSMPSAPSAPSAPSGGGQMPMEMGGGRRR